MADLVLQLKLLTTAAEITKGILDGCVYELNKRLNTGTLRSQLKRMTQKILEQAIMRQPEYDSLVMDGGVLNTELGIVDADSKMRTLINIWIRSVEVVMTPVHIVGSQVSGSIILRAIESDFADVLGSSASSFTSEGGYPVPWLKWLLTEGDNIIIATHRAVYKPAYSRTDGDIMLPTGGAGWRVPPEFSGTIDNNFVTRAVVESLDDIRDAIKTEVNYRV